MIIDSLTLKNFGTYAGVQHVALTPEPGKPIILFGGLNGGGKTTFLDALQLALYGSKARVSNRGTLSYNDYLKQSYHKFAPPSSAFGLAISFRRTSEGESQAFELSRDWSFHGGSKVQESLTVTRNGEPDVAMTEHWGEAVESMLPNQISHLFFFDGEQIKELAEGGHAAAIIGTALSSLLGVDVLTQLESDLRIFERKKQASVPADQSSPLVENRIRAEAVLTHLVSSITAAHSLQASLNTSLSLLKKTHREAEERFRSKGGDLYARQAELRSTRAALEAQLQQHAAELRELAGTTLPLLLLCSQLEGVRQRAEHEVSLTRLQALSQLLEDRDAAILESFAGQIKHPKAVLQLEHVLAQDRASRTPKLITMELVGAPDTLSADVTSLLSVLPAERRKALDIVGLLKDLTEKLARVDAELAAVPDESAIASLKAALESADLAVAEKTQELVNVQDRLSLLRKERSSAESSYTAASTEELDARFATEDSERFIKHSRAVRQTVATFRSELIKRHAVRIEQLMLESFNTLMRKEQFVATLKIDPETFEPRLFDHAGHAIPFDRLSSGERQLLATSLLWGLARASGRPVPTIVDTPLGRLDSTHRDNLVTRYFPFASQQVVLLSTDEELVGAHHDALAPFISKRYLLKYEAARKQTSIQPGYFEHETSH